MSWWNVLGVVGVVGVMLAVAVLVSLKDDYEAVNNEGKYNDGN